MLLNWGFSGYIRWLRGLKATYRMRRNWLCDTFEDVFDLEFDEAVNEIGSNLAVKEVFGGSGRGVTCYAKQITGSKADQWDEKRGIKSKRSPALVSFIPPTGIMRHINLTEFRSGYVCLLGRAHQRASRLRCPRPQRGRCDRETHG